MFRRAVAAFAVVLCGSTGAMAQPWSLGAIGDSLTDEYFEQTYTYAKNWTVLMVQQRGVNMGPTAAAASQPGGSWSEPRRTGYQYNFARYGADSATALSDGQVSGLAGVSGPAGATHAIVAIGANDFSPTTSAYINIYFGLWSQGTIDGYVNTQLGRSSSIVGTLKAAGSQVVLCNFVDFGIAPAVRSVYTNAGRRQNVANAIAQVNRDIVSLSRRERVMMVDLAGLATAIFGTHASPRSTFTVAGQNVQLLNRDTASNSAPLAGFVDDGAHPHTTVQGVFANVLITALEQGWNLGITPLSETEIVTAAGLAPTGPDAVPGQIGPYGRYVYDFRCAANFNGVSGVTVQDLFDFLAAYFAGSLDADATRDNSVTVQDLFAFLNVWFAGC